MTEINYKIVIDDVLYNYTFTVDDIYSQDDIMDYICLELAEWSEDQYSKRLSVLESNLNKEKIEKVITKFNGTYKRTKVF